MRTLDGIIFVKKTEYSLCHITNFSDTLKSILRKQLSFICYGKSSSESGLNIYNYKNTLKEFLTRYEPTSYDLKLGMIGELLAHVIINEYFNEYNIATPFFNKEERNIKKGFDIVLCEKLDYSIWITEIKSGELHIRKDSDQTTSDLLDTAKRDLIRRLNESNNSSLWLNAINDAKLVFDKYTDLKDAVVRILADYGVNDDTENSNKSSDINVFLISTLFASLSNPITEANIQNKLKAFQSENKFNKLFILSLQKSTYNKIYRFLKEEVKSAENIDS